MPISNILKKFVNFYENFDLSDPLKFSELYDKEIEFTDPFHYIKGSDNLFDYFKRLTGRVKDCRFIITDSFESNGKAVVFWKMIFYHPAIDRKKEIEVVGCTQIKFSEKVYYHRDFFDSSELIYRHLPIFGSVIRFIEGRI